MMLKLKRGVLWVGLLYLIFSICGCGGPEERKMKFYEKGKAFFQSGNYRDARLELKNAVQVDPEFTEGYFLLGKIELEKKRYKQAGGYFNKILKLSPKHIDARLMLAEMGVLAKEFDYALKKVEEVLDIEPENVKAQIIEGVILVSTGKQDLARRIAENLMTAGHKDPELYIVLAASHSWKNEKKLVEEIYRDGLKNNPESGRLLLALINLLVSEKRNEEAVNLYAQLIESEPDTVSYRFGLATLYWSLGRQGDADKIIEEISSDRGGSEEVILLSASFYTNSKRYEKAENILTTAVKEKEGKFKYRFALSDLYVLQGKKREAIRNIEEVLALKKGKSGPLILKAKNVLAKMYLSLGEKDKALEYVEKVIAANQQDVTAHFTKGTILLLQGEGDRAVNEFRQVATGNPRFVEGHLGLAEAHVLSKSYEQATDVLIKALEVNAGSRKLMRSLALVYLLKKSPEEAENQLKEILELYPEDPQTLLGLADLLTQHQKFSSAEKEYRKLATILPGNATPILRLSSLLIRDNRKGEAVTVLERALRTGNSSPKIFAALIKLFIDQDQLEAATELCLQKQQSDPGNAFYHYMLGQVYATGKQYLLAEEEYKKAIEIAPTWIDPQKSISSLYSIQGKAEEAIDKLEEILEKNPERHELYLHLGLLYEQQDRFSKVVSTYERALSANPNNWIAANNLAYVLMEKKTDMVSMEKALSYAKKAKELNPQLDVVADTLAWAYFNNYKHPQALAIMKEAFPVVPDNPTILFHMASILLKNGKLAEAKGKALRALSSSDHFPERDRAEALLQNIIALTE